MLGNGPSRSKQRISGGPNSKVTKGGQRKSKVKEGTLSYLVPTWKCSVFRSDLSVLTFRKDGNVAAHAKRKLGTETCQVAAISKAQSTSTPSQSCYQENTNNLIARVWLQNRREMGLYGHRIGMPVPQRCASTGRQGLLDPASTCCVVSRPEVVHHWRFTMPRSHLCGLLAWSTWASWSKKPPLLSVAFDHLHYASIGWLSICAVSFRECWLYERCAFWRFLQAIESALLSSL